VKLSKTASGFFVSEVKPSARRLKAFKALAGSCPDFPEIATNDSGNVRRNWEWAEISLARGVVTQGIHPKICLGNSKTSLGTRSKRETETSVIVTGWTLIGSAICKLLYA
jgi:hypothetical protein